MHEVVEVQMMQSPTRAAFQLTSSIHRLKSESHDKVRWVELTFEDGKSIIINRLYGQVTVLNAVDAVSQQFEAPSLQAYFDDEE